MRSVIVILALVWSAAAQAKSGDLLSREVVRPPLAYGADSRVHMLLNYYRRVMWDEKLNDDKDDAKGRLRSHNATNEAERFLLNGRGRLIHHYHGDADDPHRLFYLLDVIPEHRFCMS